MVSPCPSKKKNDEFAESDLKKSIKATSSIRGAFTHAHSFSRTGARRKTITQSQVLFRFKKPPCGHQTRNTDKRVRWGKCTFCLQ